MNQRGLAGDEPGWRLWAGIGAGAAAYAAAGYWLNSNGNVEEWLYRIGLTAATFAPPLWVGIYTWLGLHGDPPAAWWRTRIGTKLVIASLTLIPVFAPLAWAFWFDGGILTSTWLAWLEVSGPCVSAMAWLDLCRTWLNSR